MEPLYINAIARALLIFLGSRGVAVSENASVQIVSGLVAFGALAWSLREKQQIMKR